MAERAKRIGGRLTLSSAPGEGTRITLEVPPPPTPSEHAADTEVFLEDLGDGHVAVEQLLAPVVGDGGDEVRRPAKEFL